MGVGPAFLKRFVFRPVDLAHVVAGEDCAILKKASKSSNAVGLRGETTYTIRDNSHLLREPRITNVIVVLVFTTHRDGISWADAMVLL
jgi:hypothetical protein